MELISIFIILAGLLLGFGIGSNSGANCLASAVGAQVINYKKATYFIAFFILLGAILQGHYTISRIGTGIVDSSLFSSLAILAILLSAGILIISFSYFGLPISTTMAMVGAITGLGIITNQTITWNSVLIIFFAGFICPILAAILSFTFYKIYSKLISNLHISFDYYFKIFLLISGAFLAYSLGANDIGNAVGIIVANKQLPLFLAALIGGLSLGIGTIILGKRVMKTVGTSITQLDPSTAFTSQLGAAFAIYILTLLSIPTSTTFAIVGGIAGSGLVKGVSTVDKKTIKHILVGWLITPLLSALLALGIYRLII